MYALTIFVATKMIKQKVDKIMSRQIEKNKNVISNAMIEPLTEDYQFCTNGIYFLCSKMSGGKTYFIMRHIMITERLFKQPYYDTIIFTSTSGTLDKTVSSLQPKIATPITYVKDTDLMSFLQKHLNNKMKFYAIMEFINSGGKDVNEIMRKLIEKYHFIKIIRGNKMYDMRRIVMYAVRKMEKYKFTMYPSNTLLVLDDFAGNDLIKKVDSPLCKIMTKVRHYNLTVIIAAQTWRFINLNIKRLCSDLVIGVGYSMEDFQKMIQQTPSSQDWKILWQQYSKMNNPHAKMIIHCVTNNVEFEDE